MSQLEETKNTNEETSRREFAQRRVTVDGKPVHVDIEVTTRCNFRCFTCAKTYFKERDSDMSREIFDRVADAIFPSAQSVNLSGFGEPMLAKDFDYFFQRSADANLHIGFVSNGSLLNEKRVEQYLASRVHLMLSLDATTKETMKTMRPQCRFDKLMDIMDFWRKRRDELPDSEAQLYINYVPTLLNLHELPEVIEKAAQWNARRVNVLHYSLFNLPESIHHTHYDREPETARRWFDAARQRAEELGVSLVLPSRKGGKESEQTYEELVDSIDAPLEVNPAGSKYPLACSAPWFRIYVKKSGDITPCCGTPWPIDKLDGKSFEEVWNGQAFRRLRKRINTRFPPLYCKECPLVWGITASNPRKIFENESGIDRLHTNLQRLRGRVLARLKNGS